MGFNWSSFFLEIINFLVLVWLIKHFFYKPVRKIIDDRRSSIDQQFLSAKTIAADAQNMKEQYESRLTDWENEKQQQQNLFNEEMEERKNQQLKNLEKKLIEENQKNTKIQEKQLHLLQQKNERQALQQGIRFTAKMLQDLSSQEMESKLIEIFLNNIEHFSPEQKQELANSCSDETTDILISSAYPLTQTQRDSLQQAMQNLFESTIHISYKENPLVIAGLRVNIGSYVMRANLADELNFFSDSANGHN